MEKQEEFWKEWQPDGVFTGFVTHEQHTGTECNILGHKYFYDEYSDSQLMVTAIRNGMVFMTKINVKCLKIEFAFFPVSPFLKTFTKITEEEFYIKLNEVFKRFGIERSVECLTTKEQ